MLVNIPDATPSRAITYSFSTTRCYIQREIDDLNGFTDSTDSGQQEPIVTAESYNGNVN